MVVVVVVVVVLVSIFFELLLEFIFFRMSDHKMVIMASKYSTNNNIDTEKSLSLISKRKIK